MRQTFIYTVILSFILCTTNLNLYAKKETEKESDKKSETKSSEKYDKLFKDKKVKTAEGLFTLHKIEDKIYFEFPIDLLGERMLLGRTVEKVSDPDEATVGMRIGSPSMILFEKTDSLVLLRLVENSNRSADNENIESAIAKSNIYPIAHSFPIEAWSPDSSSVVFESTKLFVNSDKSLEPLDPSAYNSFGGFMVRKPSYQSSNSFIDDVFAFEDNASVTSILSYKITSLFFGAFKASEDIPFTAYVKHTFLLLPKEHMLPKLADSRIGTDVTSFTEYSQDGQRSREQYYSTRWKLKQSDAHTSDDELVKPKEPIVFYIDNNFPKEWEDVVYSAIDEWNKAFEKAGYSNAIEGRMFPADDEFDPNNIKYSTIRYVISPSETIRDNKWVDPLTGEIISANIYLNFNLPVAIQRDRFIQTSAADVNARSIMLSDDVLKEGIKHKLLRALGRCLGLKDNLAGSYAVDIESLRNNKNDIEGRISSSVMDNLPFNYVAQIEDAQKGISYAQTILGPYDTYVIEWLYGDKQEDTPDENNALITQNAGNPDYFYGKKQSSRAFFDPRTMELDLGNNNSMAAECGMKNLAYTISKANEWIDSEDYNYSYREYLYDDLMLQTYDYVKQAFVNVGGIYLNEKYSGDPQPTYQSVPKELQRRSLLWILEEIDKLDWVDNKELNENAGLFGSVADFCQKYFTQFIFTQIDAMYLSEMKSNDPYTQQQAMQDVYDFLWKRSSTGIDPGENICYQQNMFVEVLISWSNVLTSPSRSSSSGSSSSLADPVQPIAHLDVVQASELALRQGNHKEAFKIMSGVDYKTTSDRSHIWYGMLKDAKQNAQRAARVAKSTKLKNHYDYLVFKIERALSKK